MKFKKELESEIDKSEMFCKAIDTLNVVSINSIQLIFNIGWKTADNLLRNLLINGAVEQMGMFYKIISKDKFANICQVYGIDEISTKYYACLVNTEFERKNND